MTKHVLTLLNRATQLRSRLDRERQSERASPLILMRLQRLNLLISKRLKDMARLTTRAVPPLQPIPLYTRTQRLPSSQFAR